MRQADVLERAEKRAENALSREPFTREQAEREIGYALRRLTVQFDQGG